MQNRITSMTRLILGRELSRNTFSSHVLIPLAVMSFYFAFSALLLPTGVNRTFVTRSVKYTIPATILIGLAYFVLIRKRLPRNETPIDHGEKIFASDLLLVLFPLTPVTQYILNNRDILSLSDATLVVSFFVLLTSIFLILVPALLRSTGSGRPMIYLGLAFAFSITNMASLSRQFSWHKYGSLKIQLPLFTGIWFISWLVFRLGFRNVLHIMIVVFFSTNSLLQRSAPEDMISSVSLGDTDNMLVTLIDSRIPPITPSIYLLVYDSYVVSDTLSDYGVDNRDQENYLLDRGFRIYPHTYSVGAASITSMSRVLNVSVGGRHKDLRQPLSGNGTVQNLLREFGYRTYGVFRSDYFFRNVTPSYDHSFPDHGSAAGLLIKAILEGEFRFDIEFIDVTREQFEQEKESIFTRVSEYPKFVYTHSDLPGHSQNSGMCLPNEIELFGERLAIANLEMQHDIEMILEVDPEAIVVVAGDHGPYLTKNCTVTGEGDAYRISEISRLDIQDRYGTFLAIRWPSAGFEYFDQITVLQDLFPAIFAYIFTDPSLLGARVEPRTLYGHIVSGVSVVDGVIVGGIHDGEPLFR